MKYKVKGGGFIEAFSSLEIIEAIRSRSLNPRNSVWEFMYVTSTLCEKDNNSRIRLESYDIFAQDLIDNGFLQEASGD